MIIQKKKRSYYNQIQLYVFEIFFFLYDYIIIPVAIPLGECLAADPGLLAPFTAFSAIPFLGEPGGKLSATDIRAAMGEGPFDCTATTAPSGGLTVRLPRGETVLVTEVGTELTVLNAERK